MRQDNSQSQGCDALKSVQGDEGWDRGWEAHERRQQRRLSKLSLPEKVQWLEEIQEMVDHLHKRKSPRPT